MFYYTSPERKKLNHCRLIICYWLQLPIGKCKKDSVEITINRLDQNAPQCGSKVSCKAHIPRIVKLFYIPILTMKKLSSCIFGQYHQGMFLRLSIFWAILLPRRAANLRSWMADLKSSMKTLQAPR